MRVLLVLVALWISASAPLWADCKLTRLGEIQPVFARDRLYVPAKVNGKPVLFLVDTGGDTLLFQEAAERLGVRFTGQARGETYGMTGDSMVDSRAIVDSFELGRWTGDRLALRAVGPIKIKDVGGLPVVGLLGEDVLSNFDVEIDAENRKFALYQPEDCAGANLAYWSPSYNVVDIIRYTPRAPRIRMQAKLDDKTIAVMIDTGSPYSLMSEQTASSLGVTPDSPEVEPAGMVMGIHGHPARSWVGTFKSFTLDQERIAPAKIDFFVFNQREIGGGSRLQRPVVDVDMLLGFDFVRAHHLLISHSQQKVYFSYAGGAPFAAPKPQEPLSKPTD